MGPDCWEVEIFPEKERLLVKGDHTFYGLVPFSESTFIRGFTVEEKWTYYIVHELGGDVNLILW